jgi:protein-disulfide isomerase
MNTRRLTFWFGFIILLGLIIWGLVVAMNKPINPGTLNLSTPAPISTADHVLGPIDAPVTIIEYSDFQCPACETYYYVVERLLASSTVPIRFVYRQFPLSQHANAIPASLASEAAGVQGKFWDMYRLLFEDHADWTELSDPKPVFVRYATELGLDTSKFTIDMASSTLKDHINNDVKEGINIGINATPTFFINGKAITNPSSYDEFKTIVQDAATNSTK